MDALQYPEERHCPFYYFVSLHYQVVCSANISVVTCFCLLASLFLGKNTYFLHTDLIQKKNQCGLSDTQ